MKCLRTALLAAAVAAVSAGAAFGQVVENAVPLMSPDNPILGKQTGFQPSGPGDLHRVPMAKKFSTFSTDPRDSVFNNLGEVPAEGWKNLDPGPGAPGGIQDGGVGGGGGDSRFIDQPLDCTTGWFSNNNSNFNPYLAFDDFRAGSEPLRNVRFYGGVYDASTNSDGGIGNVVSIGIDIFTAVPSGGDLCGWTFSTFVARQVFTPAELNQTFECSGAFFDTYEMTATFDTPISLNPGEVYMITVYASMADPDDDKLFTWNQSTESNFNDATSWDRGTGEYIRCGPDQAFATNVSPTDCFENDCQTNCFFSNTGNNTNPFIVADDFTATATEDLRQLQFTGGVFNTGTGTGDLLGNISGFFIELYTIVPDGGATCESALTGFLGAYEVSMADARPVFDCIDIFGIPQYQFTVNIPASVYPLVAGTDYALGVYGVPVDPDSTELFCWGGTDAIYGLTSWSFNLDTGARETCHDVDQAFCINDSRPCLGDFNGDGNRNTQDVLAFLNAWNAGLPSSDINGDGNINTQDVLAFLNRWNIPC